MSAASPAAPLPVRREPPWWVVVLAVAFFAGSVSTGFLGALAGISLIDAVSASRDSSQSITLSPGGAVSISSSSGAVTVLPGPDGQVSVLDSVTVRSPTRDLARQALDTFEKSSLRAVGDGVAVDIPTQQDFSVVAFQFRRTVTVRVPADVALTMSGRSMAADIHDLSGPIDVHVTSGAIRLTGVTVNSADTITTTAGAIDFEGTLASGSLDVETHSGAINVRLPAGTNASYDVATTSGAIFITPEHGSPHASAGANNAATGVFGDGTGATLRLRATSGAISVRVA